MKAEDPNAKHVFFLLMWDLENATRLLQGLSISQKKNSRNISYKYSFKATEQIKLFIVLKKKTKNKKYFLLDIVVQPL